MTPRSTRAGLVFIGLNCVGFFTCRVHASPPNISPLPRPIVYMSFCEVNNAIRRFKRPAFIAHRDFAPLAAETDDCLLT